MPAVEIDEVELLRLRKQDQTVQTLLSNPKSKRKIFEAYKEHDPNARIPELDAEEAAKAPLVEMQKKFDELQKQVSEDAAKREQDSKLGQLKGGIEQQKLKFKRAGWFDEDIEAVEKLMEEKGTTDFELAAAYYEKQRPKQEPVTPRGYGGFGFTDTAEEGDDYAKALLSSKQAAESDHLVLKEATKALNEIRGAARR